MVMEHLICKVTGDFAIMFYDMTIPKILIFSKHIDLNYFQDEFTTIP